jgi:isopentenyl phosphate kinase
MRERVVIKWGGGLITDKTTLCTPKLDVIEALATSVRRCLDNDLDVILVHGAGSYGHLRAKHWRLNEGRVDADITPTISANHKPMQSHVSGKKCWRSMTMFVAHFNNKASQR